MGTGIPRRTYSNRKHSAWNQPTVTDTNDRGFAAAAVAGFRAAILCGVRYLNCLNYAANQDEKKMWADGRIGDKNTLKRTWQNGNGK